MYAKFEVIDTQRTILSVHKRCGNGSMIVLIPDRRGRQWWALSEARRDYERKQETRFEQVKVKVPQSRVKPRKRSVSPTQPNIVVSVLGVRSVSRPRTLTEDTVLETFRSEPLTPPRKKRSILAPIFVELFFSFFFFLQPTLIRVQVFRGKGLNAIGPHSLSIGENLPAENTR